MARFTATAAGFNRAALTNTSATGTGVGTFVYGCNFKAGVTPQVAWDLVAAMKGSGFFDDASDILKMGSVITLTDGKATANVVVTSATGVTPVTVA